MYFLRYYEGGKKFFDEWFKLKSYGHDQDGFNAMSRWGYWVLSADDDSKY